VKPHWEIGTALGLFDLERASKVSGSGFVFYRKNGVRLVRALLNYFMDVHRDEHGYEEIWPPLLVNRATMTGTGQLPKFEDDAYVTRTDELFSHPDRRGARHESVPRRDSRCRHRSVGVRGVQQVLPTRGGVGGKDTRGILRTHEFDKVELVRYASPETSEEHLELLTRHAETMLERLGLPYRRKLLAAGDTGFSSAMTYDLEAWAPGVGAWLEVSSCSCFTDYQARRANIRFRPAKGEKRASFTR